MRHLLQGLHGLFADPEGEGGAPEAARPSWADARVPCLLLVALGFSLVYARGLSWGWLGLDDWRFLVTNPNLGHGWRSVLWALGDVQYGRRWMPVMWLVACLCGAPTAFKFHLLVFVLGLALSLLVAEVYGRALRLRWVLPAVLLFVMSPLRIEVFTWGMGFVYVTVAIFLCIAWLLRRNSWLSGLFVVLALLTYPQAAGAAVAYCIMNRARPAGWAVGLFLVLLAAGQYRLRAELGVIPWHQRFDYLPLILPHYALNLFIPFATVPLFPSLFYRLLLVGGALVVLVAIARPFPVACWALLFAPTLLASVTEGFWFGARYCLIPSIAAYAWIAFEASRAKGRLPLLLAWVAVLAFAFLNVEDVGMSRGVGLLARVAKQEAAMVGIDFDLLQTIQAQSGPQATPPPVGAGPAR